MRSATLLKKSLWYRRFPEISKNTFFTKHLWTTASNSWGVYDFREGSFSDVRKSAAEQSPEMFYIVFLEILQNSQEKSCFRPVTIFSCEFCKIFKNNFSTGQLQATASGAESASE